MIEPVRASIVVECDRDRAFRVFTEEMGSWWPLEVHSMAVDAGGGATAESVVVERRQGGRIYELMSDGTEAAWGTILAWEPPRRLVVAWKPNANTNPPTEVEITFVPLGDRTRVELVHRGWERLDDRGRGARARYSEGWPSTLERFARVASGE